MTNFHCFLIFWLSSMLGAVTAQNAAHPDCSAAMILCSDSAVSVQTLDSGGGTSDVQALTCMDKPYPESNSTWFKWKMAATGDLAFTIVPFDPNDDIDFLLFRLESGFEHCDAATNIRCMVSGANIGEPDDAPRHYDCLGAMGLKSGASALSARPGCHAGHNFLAPVAASAGEYYALLVNNYTGKQGFLLEFTGSTAFEAIAEQCNPATSDLVELAKGNPAQFSVGVPQPNPSSGVVSIPVESAEAFTGIFSIFSADGVLVQQAARSLAAGQHVLTFDMTASATGVYYLRVQAEDKVKLLRFVKN